MGLDDAKNDRAIDKALHLLQRALTDPDPRLLDQSIDLYDSALANTPPDHPHRDRAALLSNLAIAYRLRADRTGSTADFDRAVLAAEQAVEATPPEHVERSNSLFNLAEMCMTRYERLGAAEDLDKAYAATEEGIRFTGTDHPKWLPRLMTTVRVRRARYERNDDLWALQQTIYALEEAVDNIPADHPYRPALLTHLGFGYLTMYERSGDHRYLSLVITAYEQVLAALPPEERLHVLSNLGLAYQRRYEHTGELADLERALAAVEEAIAAVHPPPAGFLSNLGSVHGLLYDHTGVLPHLERAIEAHEQSVTCASVDDPDRPGMLANLGIAYHQRFKRTGDINDLRQAIAVGEMTIASAPRSHPAMPRFLFTLGTAYFELYKHTNSLADLEQAISVGEQAVDSPTQNIVDQAMALADLSICYLSRFARTGQATDIHRAVAIAEKSITVVDQDLPVRTRYLGNLAAAYIDRFKANGTRVDTAEIRKLADQVSPTAAPNDRIRAGFMLGSLAHAQGHHPLAVELLDEAVSLLPSIVSLQSEWADREHGLAAHIGLVREAIAAHCAAGDPGGAVVVAEAGRGILLGAELDSRTDLTELMAVEPALGQQFQQIQERLNRSEHRAQLWAEHDTLLAAIREVPGFGQFLLPPRLPDLQAATEGGAVVLVNTSFQRSDAVIVTADGPPRLVPLPSVTVDDMVSYAFSLLRNDFPRFPEMLDWLADTMVGPVLDVLRHKRVWWLPTGVIGLFPLHAVALDHVVSSYVPTLRTLAHARGRPVPVVRRQLTVAMQHTPGLPDLPGTSAEAADLPAFRLADSDATTDQVLSALEAHTWAHFACHASTHITAPSSGGLHLHDRVLTLPEIARLRLTDAELAYLSACSTAHRGVEHADESLHLASAFQLAGFRHVIATLWPLHDKIAAIAAREFYRRLPEGPTADHAAQALHEVVRELRDAYPGRPELWAALIHSGP